MKNIMTISSVVAMAVVLAAVLYMKGREKQKKTIAIITTLSHPALDSARLGFINTIKAQDPSIEIKDYNAEGNVQQANLMAEQVANDTNIVGIFAIGTLAAQTIAKAEKTRPILIAAVSDAQAIAHTIPDNLAGLSDGIDAHYQIDTIKKLLPTIKSISLLYSPNEANSASMVKQLMAAAKKADLVVEVVGVHDTQSIMSGSLEACKKADAVLIPLDNQLVAAMPGVIKATRALPCPIITSNESPIHQGATLAFGVDYQKSGEDAGLMMSKILRGETTTKDIGIVTPKTVSLYKNQRVVMEKNLKLDEQAGLAIIQVEDTNE
jgi:putative tryptophan/tyrosine transport system substrate-binding protein